MKPVPEICPHGARPGQSCAVRCECGHRCDEHIHGIPECVGDPDGPKGRSREECACRGFVAVGGEG